MKKKTIKLLEKQIEKLEAKDFDLEAWKGSSESVLTRIFGKDDPRIEQIQTLRIDYSSWALRDSNASYKPIESNKRKGKEILETAIEEIELYGMPSSRSTILGEFFNENEIKILLSESDEKRAIIRSLKKEELQKLILKLL